MRPSSVYLAFFYCAAALVVGLLVLHPAVARDAYRQRTKAMARTVRSLELTDLCLFTEARYTRHPSQADLNSAFQDHPMAFEHFPSGSIVGPPSGNFVFKYTGPVGQARVRP